MSVTSNSQDSFAGRAGDETFEFLIPAARKVLADLGVTLWKMDRIAQELRVQCSALYDRFKERTCYIALVPTELLCDIFILALPCTSTITVASDRISHMRKIRRAPWTLAHVCRHWRDVAVSIPKLWTGIAFSSLFSERHELRLLNAQLRRSQHEPLDVIIGLDRASTFFDVALQRLSQHCGRWRSLHLSFGHGIIKTYRRRHWWHWDSDIDVSWAPRAEFHAQGPMPLLEEAVFSGQSLSPHEYDFLQHVPKLRKVILGSPENIWTRYIPIPCAGLTTYKASYQSRTHFRNLPAAVNLVECDIDVGRGWYYNGTPHFPPYPAPIALPCLRRLVVSDDFFLNSLHTPVLQELHVHSTIEHVLPFLQRSECTLKRLTLFKCSGETPDIVDILHHTRALTTLELDFLGPPLETHDLDSVASGTAPETPIPALTVRPSAECLCPSLTSLSWGDRNDIMDREAFVDMIESRWRVSDGRCRPLRFVGIYLGRLCMKPRGRRFKIFEAEGLEVVILNQRKARPAMERWREYSY
ncbi:hypothetical protein B0H11DRAFT_2343264 [Mycena galericulata]|nr:hypothetical protein B0H11DRAFT_2343264 [Mycena galericulata]